MRRTASSTTRIAGSPGFHWPAVTSCSTTSRIWDVVTAATSAPGSTRTASSTAVHDVRPVSSAATIEYGQPGTIWCLPSPRPKVWQKARPQGVLASGRSHGETSAASTIRPSEALGNGTEASARRSRETSIRLRFEAAVAGPVAAAVFRCRRQVDQRPHWPVRAQQGVASLEQCVAPCGQTRVQLRPEARHFRERIPQDALMPQSHDHGLRAGSSACVTEHRIRRRPHSRPLNSENAGQVRVAFDARP